MPAAGVVAEAMVALVLADALLQKLGGESLAEMQAHWGGHPRQSAAMAALGGVVLRQPSS